MLCYHFMKVAAQDQQLIALFLERILGDNVKECVEQTTYVIDREH